MQWHNDCIENMIIFILQMDFCTKDAYKYDFNLNVQWKTKAIRSKEFQTTLTLAKSIGWIAILAIVAAVPPQTKGSAIFAALFSGMFKFCDLLLTKWIMNWLLLGPVCILLAAVSLCGWKCVELWGGWWIFPQLSWRSSVIHWRWLRAWLVCDEVCKLR